MTLQDLADSQDELFCMLAEQADQIEALHALVKTRDATMLVMAKHVERLSREKEYLLLHLGLTELVRRANATQPTDTAPSTPAPASP